MWVFALSAGVIGAVIVSTLGLAIRHQRRRRNGVYARLLAENPSSKVLQVLTVGDYLKDPLLRGQIRRQRIEKAHAPADSISEGRANPPTGLSRS